MGILQLNDQYGSNALANREAAETTAVRTGLYNRAVRQENLADLGELLADVGGAGVKTYQEEKKSGAPLTPAHSAEVFGHFFNHLMSGV